MLKSTKSIESKNKKKSIFVKNIESNETEKSEAFNYSDLLSIIPEGHFDTAQPELKKVHTEWRWRLLNIDGKRYLETSYEKVGSQRLYLNKNEKYIERIVDTKYDKFVTKSFYYYSKNE